MIPAFILKILSGLGLSSIPRFIWIGLGVLALLGTVFALGRCTGGDNDDAEQQARQTERSSEAVASAAADAIETIGDRAATEKTIDAAVTHTTQEIQNAPDSDAVRDAVLIGLCSRPSHRDDPACAVLKANP